MDAHFQPAQTGQTANHPATANTVERRTGASPWAVLAIILTAVFMQLLDTTITTVGVPSIQASLHSSFGEIQLVVAGYTLAFACVLVTGGRLGNSYGRKRMFLSGMAGFTVASAACGAAPDALTLIVARVVQGMCSGLMFPQVLSIIQVVFRKDQRTKAIGLYGATIGLATILGPVTGGAPDRPEHRRLGLALDLLRQRAHRPRRARARRCHDPGIAAGRPPPHRPAGCRPARRRPVPARAAAGDRPRPGLARLVVRLPRGQPVRARGVRALRAAADAPGRGTADRHHAVPAAAVHRRAHRLPGLLHRHPVVLHDLAAHPAGRARLQPGQGGRGHPRLRRRARHRLGPLRRRHQAARHPGADRRLRADDHRRSSASSPSWTRRAPACRAGSCSRRCSSPGSAAACSSPRSPAWCWPASPPRTRARPPARWRPCSRSARRSASRWSA